MIFKEITEIAQEILKKWPVDPDRLARAVEIASKPHQIFNNQCPPGSYDVRGSAGGWYRVNTIDKTCTCKDSELGYVCKHRLAVYLVGESIRLTHEAILADAKRAVSQKLSWEEIDIQNREYFAKRNMEINALRVNRQKEISHA